MSGTAFTYVGEELDTFAIATRWKTYWSRRIWPYISGDVLEVGAGIGTNAQQLQHAPCRRWVSLEPDSRMCERMSTISSDEGLPKGHEIRCGTSRSLEDSEVFDTILYIDVLEHIHDDQSELAHICKHLRGGGHLVIVSPAHNFLYSAFDQRIGHFRRYDKTSLRAVIPKCLSEVTLHYLDSVGMLASLANRLILRNADPSPAQVQLWDKAMVPVSQLLDPLMGFRLGKTIVCVLQRPLPPANHQ